MRWSYKLPLRLRSLFRRGRVEEELSHELRFHLQKLAEENVAKGMTPEEARYAALRELGGVEQIKEECRDMRRVNWIEDFPQDVRYGLRMLAKNPSFAAAAVLTLGLGIGANTTIFSVAWRPMRYRDANRLLVVSETRPDGSRSTVSTPTYLDWRDHNRCFEQLAATRSASVTLSGNPPILVSGERITANFFDTFRLRPELGRFFSREEFRSDDDAVTLLSHELWQTQFGGEAGIVGKAIRLDGKTHIVVGVVPADFEFFGRADVWMPLLIPSGTLDRQTRDLLVVGRMKPGVTAAQAQEEMRTLAARVAQEAPETNKQWSALAQSFHEALAGPGVIVMMVLLFATVSVVLLMACANVANLLLARAITCQKEIAVRMALGGSRWRVVRQSLAETLLLAVMGGALGLLLALGAVRYLATLPVLQAPGLAPIEINRLVLEFAVALCLAVTVLSGFVPAWQTTAANLMEHIKTSGRTAVSDRGQSRLRNGLVTAELALSLVLMVTAGLSLRGFICLARVDPGFPSTGLLTAHLSLPAPQYADAGRAQTFYSELIEGVRAIPGVDDVAVSTGLPPTTLEVGQPFRVEGRDPTAPAASGVANYQVISPGYFRTLGLTLLKGRSISADDRQGSTPAVIINQRLAEKFFPASDPLGQRLLFSQLVPGRDGPSVPVAHEVSSAGESHPDALSEPYLNVSAHTAPAREPRRTPICQCANSFGSRREMRATQCVARRKCRRSFLYFR